MDKSTMLSMGWKCIFCKKNDLNIDYVLCSGQSFRWKEVSGTWVGVHGRKVWKLKQDSHCIWFKAAGKDDQQSPNANDQQSPNANDQLKKNTRKRTKVSVQKQKKVKAVKLDRNCNHGEIQDEKDLRSKDMKEGNEENILYDYFQLNVDLGTLCKSWSNVDQHFADIQKQFPGVRMLRQDPVENLFSFICSSNNNITRISSMVENMCSKFGDIIHKDEDAVFYSFPTVDKLANPGTEDVLRSLGFGYRAKYIHQAAVQLLDKGGEAWLHELRLLPYKDVHSKLVALPGIGAKVADCICMMSLDKPNAIPVDTHVWQIAVRNYNIKTLKNTKTLTSTSYNSIGQHFRNLWGDYASWAMNFLFVADLKQFKKSTIQKS